MFFLKHAVSMVTSMLSLMGLFKRLFSLPRTQKLLVLVRQ